MFDIECNRKGEWQRLTHPVLMWRRDIAVYTQQVMEYHCGIPCRVVAVDVKEWSAAA